MKDINGIEIKVGQAVRTQQPSGGIFPPAEAQEGTVCWYNVSWSNTPELAIRFEKKYNGLNIYCYILLHGKINEIIS